MPHLQIWVSHNTHARLRELAIQEFGLPAEIHVNAIAQRAVEYWTKVDVEWRGAYEPSGVQNRDTSNGRD